MQRSTYLALNKSKLNSTPVTEFTIVPVRGFLRQKHRVRFLQCWKRESCQFNMQHIKTYVLTPQHMDDNILCVEN